MVAPSLVCALLAVAIPAPAPSAESLRIQAQKLIEDRVAPGFVVVVRHRGKELLSYTGGFANLETRTPMRLESRHEMASISKTFTAAAVLRLVDEGKLKLDDPLTKHLAGAPDSWKAITIQHLLQHTSGLADYLGPTVSLGQERPARALVEGLHARPLRFVPGSRYEYSNSGYLVLGEVVAQVTGEPFSVAARRLVLEPAKLPHAVPASPRTMIPDRATGYERFRGEFVNETFVSQSMSQLGDGWLMASALDLLRWHDVLKNQELLRAETWRAAWTPTQLPEDKSYPYGFGFSVDREGEKPRISHSGGWVGTTTFFLSDHETDSCIVILANGSPVAIGPLVREATALISTP